MLFEDTIVDAGVDDEAVEVWQTHVVAGGRGPNKQDVKDHVASGHAQRRTWCDAWMRARGIAGRQEKRELGRKDEDPLVATGYGYLKLDGTDDDADDEVAQNKLLILVVNDVKTGALCCNLSARQRCE